MKGKTLLGLALFMMSLLVLTNTMASARMYCPNATYSIEDNTVDAMTMHIPIMTYTPCPFGCNNMTGDCERSPGYTGMEFTTFILIFFISLGALVLGMARGSIASSAIALALFAVLSFSGFNLEYISGGQVIYYGTNIILIWVCVIFLFISLIALLYNSLHGRDEVIESIDEEKEED